MSTGPLTMSSTSGARKPACPVRRAETWRTLDVFHPHSYNSSRVGSVAIVARSYVLETMQLAFRGAVPLVAALFALCPVRRRRRFGRDIPPGYTLWA